LLPIFRKLKETAANSLQRQIENQLKRGTHLKSKPTSSNNLSSTTGAVFLVFGIFLLVFSVFISSQIIAFIGLGLTFWGALFNLIKTTRYIEVSLLETTTVPEYMNIDRIIADSPLRGDAFCLPSFLKEGYFAENLKGLKETVTFIPAEKNAGMVSIEELVKGKFQIENPKGVLMTSPGIGILDRIEQELNTDFEKISLEEFAEVLPQFLQKINLTKDAEIAINGNEASLKIADSVYKNLYSKKYDLKSISTIGCPIVNAVACAIAKITGKPVSVQEIHTSQNGQSTTAIFKILQAQTA
jgi:hypothetical protein